MLCRAHVLPLLLLATPLAFSQTVQTARPLQPEDFGTVSGHITCSDTQRPARLAEVRLVPVAITAATKPDPFADSAALGGGIAPVQTDLSGAFTVRQVKPGQYYLRVDYSGYITPLLGFSRDQLAKPTPDIQQRMERDLQVISVAPHATTQADAVIARGAAISGTVSYDDGTPAIGVRVRLFRRNAKGEFKDEYQPSGPSPATDDHGHFREDALAPGDYVVEAELSMSETSLSTMPMTMPGGKEGTMQVMLQKYLFNLPIFSGNVLRRRDAALVQAAAGQEASGVDLSVPLSKLHNVSGSLLARDGHAINGGDVQLLHADDREMVAEVGVDHDDREFHFLYVPEDDYVLSAPAPKDITQVEVENAKGTIPRTHMEDKTVRTYGAAEQPLKVETDMTGVLVNVPDKKDPAAPGDK